MLRGRIWNWTKTNLFPSIEGQTHFSTLNLPNMEGVNVCKTTSSQPQAMFELITLFYMHFSCKWKTMSFKAKSPFISNIKDKTQHIKLARRWGQISLTGNAFLVGDRLDSMECVAIVKTRGCCILHPHPDTRLSPSSRKQGLKFKYTHSVSAIDFNSKLKLSIYLNWCNIAQIFVRGLADPKCSNVY